MAVGIKDFLLEEMKNIFQAGPRHPVWPLVMLGLAKTVLKWEEILEGGRTSPCTFFLQVGRTLGLVFHGALSWVQTHRAEGGRAAVGPCKQGRAKGFKGEKKSANE